MEEKQKFSPVPMNGSIWDEGGKTDIVQILIAQNCYSINAIQFVYAVNGKLLRSEIHGKVTSKSGFGFATVGFDYPSEYLVSVSGWHNCYHQLASITFGTNKRTYGPFGSAGELVYNDTKFAYYFAQYSSFGGFHGCVRAGSTRKKPTNLSIGVYIRDFGSLAEFMTDNSSG